MFSFIGVGGLFAGAKRALHRFGKHGTDSAKVKILTGGKKNN
jgi:hypothetical protein